MKARRVHEADGLRTYVAVLDEGDEVIGDLTRLAAQEGLTGASVSAIGALSSATVGYFDRGTTSYLEIPVAEQVEVLALTGDIACADQEPRLHLHAVLGTRTGDAIGGHLLRGEVWPTLEVVVVETPAHLRRTSDSATGLALIDLDRSGIER